MTPEEEFELVKKAIVMGRTVTGCFEWDEHASRRVQLDPELRDLTSKEIRIMALEFYAAGGTIKPIKEQRPEYNECDFYYKMIIPTPEFSHGLFVEMRLFDENLDCPTVLLVNAHPQHK